MALTTSQYQAIFVNDNGLLTTEAFVHAIAFANETKRPLDQVLTERSFISQSQFLQLLGNYFDTPSTELKLEEIDPAAVQSIPEEFSETNHLVAFARDENTISVAMEDPTDKDALQAFQHMVNGNIKVYVATRRAIQRARMLYDGDLQQQVQVLAKRLEDEVSDDPNTGDSAVVHLVDLIIETAIMMEASDIHIEPFETEIVVRFRIDGMLRTIVSAPPKVKQSLMARLKIIADLKVDQMRLPQDGRFSLNIKDEEVNFRVSTVPGMWGEKAVLRVLPKEAHLLDTTNIGMLDEDLAIVRNYLKRPHGMILVTGPTGSGKSTTLYSFLQEIGDDRIDLVNMSTIEDPIEYNIPRVTQIQVQPEIDLTFASGLRALLRQDPDIIMVGEIRDQETADFAIRAALVGRLLLSSLHTNDAPATIPRLLDMGIEPYLISSTLALVIAQRLARKLCIYCRESYIPSDDVLNDLRTSHDLDHSLHRLQERGSIGGLEEGLRFYKAVGCAKCNNTGYKGRCGIFELLQITDKLRTGINHRADSTTMRNIALGEGMKTMFEDGLVKILLGTIDLDELLRVAYS